jgi:hypothetical protein
LKLHPLDWDFSSCPPDELPILYCYEFSRELSSMLREVGHMRYGEPKESSYWTPDPNFGWPEWPEFPFLAVPVRERARRLALLMVPDPMADIVQITARPTVPRTVLELQIALVKHIREQTTPKPAQRNRGSDIARYRDQLRALSVYRLMEHFSARDVVDFLREHYRRPLYTRPNGLYKVCHRASQHLQRFEGKARAQIREGQWFPPFGRYLVSP